MASSGISGTSNCEVIKISDDEDVVEQEDQNQGHLAQKPRDKIDSKITKSSKRKNISDDDDLSDNISTDKENGEDLIDNISTDKENGESSDDEQSRPISGNGESSENDENNKSAGNLKQLQGAFGESSGEPSGEPSEILILIATRLRGK